MNAELDQCVVNIVLEPHQQRVVQERKELVEKLVRLRSFAGSPNWSKLPEDERARLFRQTQLMDEYAKVLNERIAAFVLPQI